MLFLKPQNRLFPQQKPDNPKRRHRLDSTVASAAPSTPICSVKMKIGSRMMFSTAPISTDSMLTVVKPWAEINAFIPREIWTNTVPSTYRFMYSIAGPMVLWLAPKVSRMGCANRLRPTVSAALSIKSRLKQLPMVFSAFSYSRLPIKIDA